MLTCLFDINGTANVDASHKRPGQMDPLFKAAGCNNELTVACVHFIILKLFWPIVHEGQNNKPKAE